VEAEPQPDSAFPPTRWSLVLDVRDGAESSRKDALEQLCEVYWLPAYSYVRRTGKTAEEARDLTQAFFLDLLERDTFAKADPDRGRMRTFLLTALKHFLAKAHRHQTAAKRGSGIAPISIDERDAEGRYLTEPAETVTPELLFERRWATTLFERALDGLRNHFEARGKLDTFETMQPFLAKDGSGQSHAQAATTLGMNESAFGVAVFRMRKRFRVLLEEAIRDTLAHEGEFNDELNHLHAIFLAR
jgi:RNA polymerase sigma-70 factor (ECF subfamily)